MRLMAVVVIAARIPDPDAEVRCSAPRQKRFAGKQLVVVPSQQPQVFAGCPFAWTRYGDSEPFIFSCQHPAGRVLQLRDEAENRKCKRVVGENAFTKARRFPTPSMNTLQKLFSGLIPALIALAGANNESHVFTM